MAEILDFIFEIFRVQNFASKFNTPMDQVLYVLFFPTIIMVMFILYLGKEANFGGHKGLEILLTLAFFIFLIVYPPNASYSLYSVFAQILGTIWYLFFILFGFVYFIVGRFIGGGGGAPKGGGKGLSSAYKAVRGKEFPGFEVQMAARERLTAINIEISELEEQKKHVGPEQKDAYDKEMAKLVRERAELRQRVRF